MSKLTYLNFCSKLVQIVLLYKASLITKPFVFSVVFYIVLWGFSCKDCFKFQVKQVFSVKTKLKVEKKISCEWRFMTIGYKRRPYYMIILSITHSLRQSHERALAPHTRVRYSQSPSPRNPLIVNSVSVAPVLLVDGWNCSVPQNNSVAYLW